MNMNMSRPHGRAAPDEELIDSLIAVSVIAKRLAEKLRKQMEKEKPSAPHRYGTGEGRQGKRRIHNGYE